jgi:hypothetical protein
VDLTSILNISGISSITPLYEKFLTLFPSPLHWVVSLIVLVSIVIAFFVLIRFNWLFLLLLVVFLPLAFPILKSIFSGLYDLFFYLVQQVAAGIPKNLIKP